MRNTSDVDVIELSDDDFWLLLSNGTCNYKTFSKSIETPKIDLFYMFFQKTVKIHAIQFYYSFLANSLDFKIPKKSLDLTQIPWILWNLPFFCDSSDLCLLDCVPIMKEFFHLFLISWLNHFKNHSKAKDRLISIGSKWEKKSRNGFKWKSDYSNKRARKCTNCKCTKICTQSFRVFDNTVTRCYSDIRFLKCNTNFLRLVLVMRVQIA